MTVRQLLCHTSGFEGDIFTDTGPSDDCVEKYVATLADLPPALRARRNVLLQQRRLLRARPDHRGAAWQALRSACLREHLFAPLGLTHAATGATRRSCSVPRLVTSPDPTPTRRPAPVWSLVRSNAPAGSMLAMSPSDLIAFAKMHIDGGRPDGNRILSGPHKRNAGAAGQASGARSHGRQLGPWLGALRLGGRSGHRPRRRNNRPERFPPRDPRAEGRDCGADKRRQPLPALPGDRRPGPARAGRSGDAREPEPPTPRAEVDVSRYVGPRQRRRRRVTVSQDDDGPRRMERTPKGDLAETGRPGGGAASWCTGTSTRSSRWRPTRHPPPHAFVGDDGNGRALYMHTGRADRRA